MSAKVRKALMSVDSNSWSVMKAGKSVRRMWIQVTSTGKLVWCKQISLLLQEGKLVGSLLRVNTRRKSFPNLLTTSTRWLTSNCPVSLKRMSSKSRLSKCNISLKKQGRNSELIDCGNNKLSNQLSFPMIPSLSQWDYLKQVWCHIILSSMILKRMTGRNCSHSNKLRWSETQRNKVS